MKKATVFILLLGTLLFLYINRPSIAAVDLFHFIAEPRAASSMLHWKTATEIDNEGCLIQRGLDALGPFSPISPFIPLGSNPFIGHFSQYENVTAVIGIQYYYLFEILNADRASDYTMPVGAIIVSSDATSTVTPTITKTLNISPGPTLTYTPTRTNLVTNTPTVTLLATRTPIILLPTSTITITTIPTAMMTHTVTPTLVISVPEGIVFPEVPPVENEIQLTSDIAISATPTHTLINNPLQTNNPSQNLIFLAILLWIALAIFLLLFIRRISRHETKKP